MMTLEELRSSSAPVLTLAQTREVLEDVQGERLDIRTVTRAAKSGQLPAILVGRRVLVVREKLLAMLSADQPGTHEPQPAA